MNSVDPLSSSLYFAATASATQKLKEEAKNDKSKKVGKSFFTHLVEEKKSSLEFELQGLPPEIASMNEEDAFIFLKDALDTAGDALSASANPESYGKYKTAVSHFMKYLVKNNFVVNSKKRFGRNRKGKPRDPAIQIDVINKKLDGLAYDVWYNHLDKLKMLEKVHEINGLLIDLIAS